MNTEGFVNTNREATITLNSNPAAVDSAMERSANEAKVKTRELSTAVVLSVRIHTRSRPTRAGK